MVTVLDYVAKSLQPPARNLVGSYVPAGLEGYTRILHPVWRRDENQENRVSWSQVATWSGLPLRRDGQFHSVALPPNLTNFEPPWNSGGPKQGKLETQDADCLLGILTQADVGQECLLGFWEGYTSRPEPLEHQNNGASQVQLFSRNFAIYQSRLESLHAALLGGGDVPNLVVSAESLTYIIVSEVDFSSTYVGGSPQLVEAIHNNTTLEAIEVQLGDDAYRIEEWVTRAVADAARMLTSTGDVEIVTGAGSVRASLRRRRTGSRDVLCVEANGIGKAWPKSERLIKSHDGEELRRLIEYELLGVVIGLVGW
jgi:hypothetical protein